MRPDLLLVITNDDDVIGGDVVVETTAAQIHAAWHRANPHHAAVFHTHMPYATAISMLKGGRLEPAHQTALGFWDRIGHLSPYNGLALDPREGARLGNPDSPDVVFLANHGVVVAGASTAEAFDDLYYLE